MDKGFQSGLGDGSDGNEPVSETATLLSLNFKCPCHIGGGNHLRLDQQIAQSHSLFDDALPGRTKLEINTTPFALLAAF